VGSGKWPDSGQSLADFGGFGREWDRIRIGEEGTAPPPALGEPLAALLIAEKRAIMRAARSIGGAPKMRRTDRGVLRNSRRERDFLVLGRVG